MKRLCQVIATFGFILALSATTLVAQPYNLDENGHGTSVIELFIPPLTNALSFSFAPDPTGGIITSRVLIYSLGWPVAQGDVALMGPDGTIADLLRFYTPPGQSQSGTDVIFYSRVGGGSLADVGIPISNNPVVIPETGPVTVWRPGYNQPGMAFVQPVFASFVYNITFDDVPEPSPITLLLLATGVWLATYLRKKPSPPGGP